MLGLQIKFSSRTAGSFGNSRSGKLFEWLTRTWLKFTCVLFSAAIMTIVAVSQLRMPDKLLLVVLAPLFAIVYWYVFLFLLLICRHIGLFGRILAHVLIIYFFLFSRLIVQEPPKVWLPLA